MASDGFNWKLVILPIIALVDLIVVLLYGAGTLDPTDLGDSVRVLHIVIVGLIIFLIILAIELWLLYKTFEDESDEEPIEDEPEEEHVVEAEPEPEPEPVDDDIEILHTDDRYEGRDVLEIARPPKRAVDSGIYATTYLPVNDHYVLRLEDLIAVQEA